MSISQPAETRSNRSNYGSEAAAAGTGKLLEMSKRLLFYIAFDYDTLIKSTTESADRENTYEHLRGNIRVGAERFRCTEITTNVYRAS